MLLVTLPDQASINVDLDWIGGMKGLMIMEDEDVAAKRLDTGCVHCCILGKGNGGKQL